MEETTLLAPKDAGRLLGITTSGVTRLVEHGKLSPLRDSAGRRLYVKADVLRLIEERAAKRRKRQANAKEGTAA